MSSDFESKNKSKEIQSDSPTPIDSRRERCAAAFYDYLQDGNLSPTHAQERAHYANKVDYTIGTILSIIVAIPIAILYIGQPQISVITALRATSTIWIAVSSYFLSDYYIGKFVQRSPDLTPLERAFKMSDHHIGLFIAIVGLFLFLATEIAQYMSLHLVISAYVVIFLIMLYSERDNYREILVPSSQQTLDQWINRSESDDSDL